MATDFQLPDIAPPGHTFPSRNGTPTQAPKVLSVDPPTLKLDTRQIVIAVTAASSTEHIRPPSPAHVVEGQFPSTAAAASAGQGLGAGEDQAGSSSQWTWAQEISHVPNEISPVMRSMFPQLNSTIPISQQQYYPTLERAPPLVVALGETTQYSPSLYSQPRSPPTALLASDPWTASRIPSTVINASPLRITEESPPEISSSEQLLDLWSIANGQDSSEVAETYTLGLKCLSLGLDHEALSLTSSSSSLYTLHASGSTVILTRSHPLDPSKETTICNPTLSAPSVIHPELATFFPTLAELVAIDTASSIAASHRLPRQEGIRLQTEALDRARRAEATTLLWDSDSSSYYLGIPTLHPPPGIETAPTALPIEITSNSIRFLSATSQPILTFDLNHKTLNLRTSNITSLASSLHTLDILLSSLLTLLLHLHRHTGLLAAHTVPIPRFDPPPTRASPRPSSSRKLSSAARQHHQAQSKPPSRWLSIRNPLSTPRPQSSLSYHTATMPSSPNPSHAPTSLTLTRSASGLEDKDLEAAWPVAPVSIPIAGVAPELRGSNTGVDLSRFQAFDLEDPQLSGTTKVLLRVLYWGFGVVVWIFGVGVGCIAAAIVAVGGCIGGRGLGSDG